MTGPSASSRNKSLPIGQYGLRTLLLGLMVISLLLAGLREVIGRVELEGDSGGAVLSTGSISMIVFTASSEEEARNLARHFDSEAFMAIVRQHAGATSPDAPSALGDFAVYSVRADSCFLIKCDYLRWGRYRFDITQLRYDFDVDDSVARQRNAEIKRALLAGGNEWAKDKPAILRVEIL
jgi:hypothetical protein